MVMSKSKIKRKRKQASAASSLIDDSPKRKKVHAQRKFAQGSNVNSFVLTPVEQIEKQENDVLLPEPVELLPMKRPNTEDFLTFLCFRGTPLLPTSLNFFNSASIVDTNGQVHKIKNGPIDTIPKTGASPFVAFGVRKRADPIVISKQMDKKRRHVLALQTLRRKYQEQKMAKIRAITISKLSQKVGCKTLIRSNSITKKKVLKKTNNIIPKTKTNREETVTKATIKPHMKPTMCLRSFRGRFVQRELQFSAVKKSPVKNITEKNNESPEYSSDDEPLVKKVRMPPMANRVAKKLASGPKKPSEVNFRVTRSNMPNHILKPMSEDMQSNIKKESKETSESRTNERPTRKTKEAAAIYMEILNHELVNESRTDDDNVSIDRFPELPNVKKMEQRENELKANNTDVDKKTLKVEETKCKGKKKIASPKGFTEIAIRSDETQKKSDDAHTTKSTNQVVIKQSQNSVFVRKTRSTKPDNILSTKTKVVQPKMDVDKFKIDDSEPILKPNKTSTKQKANNTSNADAESLVSRSKEQIKSRQTRNSTQAIRKKTSAAKSKESESDDDSSLSDIQLSKLPECKKNKKITKVRSNKKSDQSFSDSDEEPLSKLTRSRSSKVDDEKKKSEIKSGEKDKEISKPKRECAKRPQNYLPMFSSSEEDEFFSGEVKINPVPKPPNKSFDLSCKDIGKIFGKGKVNMLNEQIEKWLKDSGMAANNDYETLSYCDKTPTDTTCSVANSIDIKKLKNLITTMEKQEQNNENKNDFTAESVDLASQLTKKLTIKSPLVSSPMDNVRSFNGNFHGALWRNWYDSPQLPANIPSGGGVKSEKI